MNDGQTCPKTANDGQNGVSASEISVSLFRQIHHLPLVWQGAEAFSYDGVVTTLQKAGWAEIAEPLRALSDDASKPDPAAFNEFVYFHDFARDFLYPHGEQRPFRLFEKRDNGTIRAAFRTCGQQEFEIERLTLHLFRTEIAILTVETLHRPGEVPLTLAQTQTIIDQFRRSYTPFWDKNGVPEKTPTRISTPDTEASNRQSQTSMIEFLEKNRDSKADAPLLEPWKSWLSPLGHENWRDPSDERVPVMSFIVLKKTEGTNRATFNRIREQDWYRLAEADGGGDSYEYNPAFLEKMEARLFYDRFRPDSRMAPYLATRHVFGGAHYSMVTVDGDFSRFVLQEHFRRHYEKMALVVRFEFATLLAFSSRLTKAVKALEADRAPSTARGDFRAEVMEIHRAFLEFTHRYHFTGISCQIQGGEMFERWRASLALDRLYADVKDEITSASEYAQAVQADQKSEQGNWLAYVAIFFGTLLAAPGLVQFQLFRDLNAWLGCITATNGYGWAAPWLEILVPITLVALPMIVLIKSAFRRISRR